MEYFQVNKTGVKPGDLGNDLLTKGTEYFTTG